MDAYGPHKDILGTDVTTSLRAAGFNGAIFIRSANDSARDEESYLKAKATGCLSKKTKIKAWALHLAFILHSQLSRVLIPGVQVLASQFMCKYNEFMERRCP